MNDQYHYVHSDDIANIVKALLLLEILLSLVGIWSSFEQLDLLGRPSFSKVEGQENDARAALVATIHLVATAVTTIFLRSGSFERTEMFERSERLD